MGEIFTPRRPVRDYSDYRIVGLDMSLNQTGFCVMEPGSEFHTGVVHCEGHPFELLRYNHVAEELMELIDPTEETVVVFEHYAVGKNRDTAIKLCEMGGIIKYRLYHDFLVPIPQLWKVHVPTLKRFAFGKGKGDKAFVMKEVYKRFGEEFDTDDECDAFLLAKAGWHIVHKNNDGLISGQMEALQKIREVNGW